MEVTCLSRATFALSIAVLRGLALPTALRMVGTMPRSKAPPRVKGPYSERGGKRFRIRICDVAGHHDLYFSTLEAAVAGKKEAEREFPLSSKDRSLGKVLDEYTQDKVLR